MCFRRSKASSKSTGENPTEMGAASDVAEEPSKELLEAYISIWEKAVDTQMHFNEMSVKARQFGLTFVAAALGLGITLLSRDKEPVLPITLGHFKFELHAVVLLALASAFALLAVRQLDMNVYHKMLRGAVTFGEDFEEAHLKPLLKLKKGMTQAISHFSRYSDAAVNKENTPYSYEGSKKEPAYEKVGKFYNMSIFTLVVLSIVLFGMTGNFSCVHGRAENGGVMSHQSVQEKQNGQ